MLAGMRVTRLPFSWWVIVTTCLPSRGSGCMGETLMGSIMGGSGSPEEENLFAGQPYFDLFR